MGKNSRVRMTENFLKSFDREQLIYIHKLVEHHLSIKNLEAETNDN